jgi:hypothetical protein
MFNNIFHENYAVYETMSKNVVQPWKAQITIKYGAWAFRAG